MKKEKMMELKALICELYDELGLIETEEIIETMINEIDFSAFQKQLREEEDYQRKLDEDEEFLDEEMEFLDEMFL